MIHEEEKLMQKNVIIWQPLPGLAKIYYLDNMQEKDNELTISLKSAFYRDKDAIIEKAEHTIVLTFTQFLSYLVANESHRLNTIYKIYKQFNKTAAYTAWSFFTVENTQYPPWITHDSQRADQIIHYFLCTDDIIIDIFAEKAPTVFMINS